VEAGIWAPPPEATSPLPPAIASLFRATFLESPTELVVERHLDRMMAAFEVTHPPLDLRAAFQPSAHSVRADEPRPHEARQQIDEDVVILLTDLEPLFDGEVHEADDAMRVRVGG
jgi:hypothetical protein